MVTPLLVAGPGSQAAPGITFSGFLGTGFWLNGADDVSLVSSGVQRWRFFSGSFITGTDNVYDIGYSSSANRPRTIYAGTSVVTPLVDANRIRPSATSLILGSFGTEYWYVNGSFLAVTDNIADIGAAGANRPRTVYAGTSVVTPLLSLTSNSNVTGTIYFTADNTYDIGWGGGNRVRSVYAGTSVVTPLLDSSGMHAAGANSPSTGQGLELIYSGGVGVIQAYDRSGSVYLPVRIAGSTITLQGSGAFASGDKYLIVDATGHVHVSALGPAS